MILNFGKRKSIEITNADEITDLLANKLHAKNDEVMLLTQEVDKLGQELNDKDITIEQLKSKLDKYYDDWIAANEALLKAIEENKTLNKANKDVVLTNARFAQEMAEIQEKQHTPAKHKQEISKHKETVKKLNDLITGYAENEHLLHQEVSELQVKLSKQSSKELKKQLDKAKKINKNQLNYIEILHVLASQKADKSKLNENFSHNLQLFVNENNLTLRQASELLGISKTSIGSLISRKVNVTYDNFDLSEGKLCDYFNCSVYELVSGKMEGK